MQFMQKNCYWPSACSLKPFRGHAKVILNEVSKRFNTKRSSKILRIMRLTTFLLTVTLMHAWALTNAQRITLSAERITLQKVFSAIREQTGYATSFDRETVQETRTVNIHVKDMPLENFLQLIVENQSLKYAIRGKTIFITSSGNQSPETVQAASPVRVRVVDSTGIPLPGASVINMSSKVTRITDTEGFISLDVQEGDILMVSYVGMETRRIPITAAILSNAGVSVVLNSSISKLEEVSIVNTGYQNLARERVTGSFSYVDSATFRLSNSGSLLQRLDGLVSGMQFLSSLNSSETNFYDRSRENIQVQNQNTIFSNTSPLIVVDNFPYEGNLRNINPDDVLSITVSKDAAAASIWGARASNGVIVITTRNGHLRQPLKVNYNAGFEWNDKRNMLYNSGQMTSAEMIDVQTFLFDKGYYNNIINGVSPNVLLPAVEILLGKRNGTISDGEAGRLLDSLGNNDVRNDLEKYLFRQPFVQRHNLNISGGGDRHTFYFSGGLDRALSSSRGNDLTRMTINNKNSFSFFRNALTLYSDIRFSHVNNHQNAPSMPSNIYDRLVHDNGEPVQIRKYRNSFLDTVGQGRLADWYYYPLQELDKSVANNRRTETEYLVSFGMKWNITRSLDVTANYRYEQSNGLLQDYDGPESFAARDAQNSLAIINYTTGDVTYPVPPGGILQTNNLLSKRHYGRAQLHFGKTWNDHAFDALAGADISHNRSESATFQYYGYDIKHGSSIPVDMVGYYSDRSSGQSSRISSGQNFSGTTIRAVDAFSNLSYTYLGRYTLNASARQDGANILGVKTNQRWIPLWSAGVKWDITRENFFTAGWISSLQLRASHGYVGNINNSLSALLTTQRQAATNLYNRIYATVLNPPNAELRWEKVEKNNLGLDWGLFQGRITGSLDYYWNKSTDLIGTSPMDPTSGIGQFKGNVASMKGKGFDLVIQSRNIRQKFGWNTTFMLSHISDRITDYYYNSPSLSSLTGGTLSIREGFPVNPVFSFPWAGLNASGQPQGYLDKEISSDWSSIVNNADLDQALFHGTAVPRYFGSLLNTFSWKGLELNILMLFKMDYYKRSHSFNYASLFAGGLQTGLYRQRWQQPGDELVTNVPAMEYPVNDAQRMFYSQSELFVYRADHVRLQYIQLAYSVPQQFLRKNVLTQCQVFGKVENAGIIWKKNRQGIDPETGNTPSITGTALGRRNLSAGVRVHF